MYKDTISLIIVVISVGYILLTNQAYAETPPAAPTGITIKGPAGDNPCRDNKAITVAGDPTVICLKGDKQAWLLLPKDEIHRLLSIHVSE